MNQSNSDQVRWFREEVQPHEAALRAYLRHLFPSLADPDDVVQDSYVRVLRARERGPVRSGKALLFSIARNAALDLFRRRRVVRFQPIAEAPVSAVLENVPDAAEIASRKQELELLTEAIQALPDRCRQVLTLRKLYGLSQREIAARLGIAEHTVEVQVANGMRRCAEYLAQRGVVGARNHV